MTPAALAVVIDEAFRTHRPQIPSERSLCDAIEVVLRGHPFEREFRLTDRDRPDFVVGLVPLVAVEVKVKGSLADLTRQLFRYAEHDEVSGILVVTTRSTHRELPTTILGRPVAVCYIGGLYL